MGDSALDVIIPAASGLLGALLGSIVPFLLNRKASRLEYKLKMTELDKMESYRMGDAFARLQSDSLGVRMGALFELKKAGLGSPEEQADIVRVLSSFIRERIENKELMEPSRTPGYELRPREDVFEACKVVSLFYRETGCRAELDHLIARGFDLSRLQLEGANLSYADFQHALLNGSNFQKAFLIWAKLQHTNFIFSKLQGANFKNATLKETQLGSANLQGVKGLTAKHLLYVHVAHTDEVTIDSLDPDLRAEYDRLKAERGGGEI